MQERTENQKQLNPEARKVLNKDLLRIAFMSQITISYLEELFSRESASKSLKQNAQIAVEALSHVKNNIETSVSSKGNKFLSKKLGEDKLFDIALVIEEMAKIGAEENQEMYEEFQSLVLDLVQAVFYAQENRKNIHFSKYKALFQLIRDELKADTDRVPGRVWYRSGEIWFRAGQPNQNTDIKDDI